VIVTGIETETEIGKVTGIVTEEEREVVAGTITVMIDEVGEVAVVEVWRVGNLVVVLGNHTGIWAACSPLQKIFTFHIQMLRTDHNMKLRNTGFQKKLP